MFAFRQFMAGLFFNVDFDFKMKLFQTTSFAAFFYIQLKHTQYQNL